MNTDEQTVPDGESDRRAEVVPGAQVAAERLTQPIDAEQAPRLPFPVVGIGASAGGLEAITQFLDALPASTGMAFVVVQHLSPDRTSMMDEILGRHTTMPVAQVEEGVKVEPDHVYVIRPGRVLTIHEGRLHLGPRLGTPRAANRPVDDFFRSLAEEQRERAVAIIFSGMGSNGTAGAQAIKAVGGVCIAQDPESAQFSSMPQHLIDSGYADYILRPADIPEVLLGYARHSYATGGRETSAETALQRDGRSITEILAVLRTRTHQDFSGYKKPTVLRRIQRRMGLARVESMAEYAKYLRQNLAELTALADDMLIHVTGFFRDPESWEALRRLVIAPLVGAREAGGTVRAWVTACSSGEEAYTLAMLLVEEADRANKPLDIKVFATDLAERSLAHARAGVYPGGIESEITPDRLERFFARDDAVYRIRPELRDRVVFAPQNLLQDPPFSRLDIASCRNLLIYLESEVQQRVLSLLHFGLRDGGTLFLGSTEAIAGAEEMYEPIDKRARIFRRIGPVHASSVEFPLPHALPRDERRSLVPANGSSEMPRLLRRWGGTGRLPIALMTQRTLLEDHTPPAVAVDRDHQILYYHGDTRPFLQQPSGEPTRDLMLLAREGIRGATREALRQATALNARATSPDGWLDPEAGRRLRIAVSASPILSGTIGEENAPLADYFVVSFEERGDFALPIAEPEGRDEGGNLLRRLRAELQSTIEELQSRNEEMQASNEEVMSINEEMQSANEELETSKEEMQSLNEELSTVNSQLRIKMEEHQAASSDLASLLASTDIAVLFLDTAFRIRRYTPAFRDLMDLISSDVGRPLAALTRRFDDPHLDDDARSVLERLVPVEREVTGSGGRHFLRRLLPYRTTDNRIEGVVLTFIDISTRKRAEEALRASEARQAFLVRLNDRLRALDDPAEIQHEAARALGQHLGAGRVGYAEIPEDGGTIVVGRNYTDGMADLAGTYTAEARDSLLLRDLAAGRVVVRDDIAGDPDLSNDDKAACAALGVGAAVDVPLVRAHGAAGVLFVHHPTARDWSAAEMGLLEETAKRTRAAAERARSGASLRVNEERLRSLVTATSNALYRMSPDWAEMRQLHGRGFLRDTETTDRAWIESYIHPDDHQRVAETIRDVIRSKSVFELEHRVVRADGSLGWTLSRAVPILGGDGEVVEWFGSASDITHRKQAESDLHRAKERLQLALSAARMGIWTWNQATDTHTRDANLNQLMGLEPVETSETFDSFLQAIHPEDRAAVTAAFTAASQEEAPLNFEFRVIRPDGTVRWLRDQGDVFEGREGQPPHMTGACLNVTDLKEAEAALVLALDELEARVADRTAELSRANTSLTDLLRRLVTVQEDERRRVSRELHDVMGQELVALILGMTALERTIPEDAPGRHLLREVERIGNRISREAHALAVELRPTALDDIGVGPALAAYVAQWSERTGVAVDYQTPGLEGERLGSEVETTVYRVVQESLNNVAKHARASRVSVIVERRRSEVVAIIEDNGQGFNDEPATGARRRLGLIGMRERVALISGDLLIESSEGEGTTIRARIPIEPIDDGGADDES